MPLTTRWNLQRATFVTVSAAAAGFLLFSGATIAEQQHSIVPLLDYSACTARAAVRFDDGRSDFAPIARAVAAECLQSYRAYLQYMERHHPGEPVLSDSELAISAVQYERKYGPARIAGHPPHN
jgi:uncharacterized short protein YbdD (DUF466 family)